MVRLNEAAAAEVMTQRQAGGPMNLFVLLKMVPDTVEELTVADNGRSLDAESVRYKLSDPDEHALEQALLLKEQHGGTVTVLALEAPEIEPALYAALAKGADRAVLITGDWAQAGSYGAASLFAAYLQSAAQALSEQTLILVRGQSMDDLEGEIGPYLAERLGLPYLSVVTGLQRNEATWHVTKEFAGGWRGVFRVTPPAVLGMQSAEKPPRYVPFAKVRQAMKTAQIERVAIPAPEPAARVPLERLYPPEPSARAQMIEGAPEEVAARLVEILQHHHLV